jgi:penicillin-binding protein 1A
MDDQPKKVKRSLWQRVLIGIAIACIIAFAAAGTIAKAYIDDAPPLDLNKIKQQSQTSFFYDSDGTPIAEYFGYENRIWVSINEIPDHLKKAFIAIEDKRFYEHNGLDIQRLGGAVLNNIKGAPLQGASTITQQLVKNCFLSFEQTYERKIQEAYLALKLEREYSKDQILEAYLNTINMGEGNYGIKAAAKDYFGKNDLNDLTLRECAALAAVPKSPSHYNPRNGMYGPENDRQATRKRTDLVLSMMLENGFISERDYQQASSDNLEVREEPVRLKLYDNAPFIEYAIYELRDELMRLNGWTGEDGKQKAEEYIYSGGLKIYTSMDQDIQGILEDTVYNWDKYPRIADANSKETISGERKIPQPQAAAVIIDYKTGHIKAMVGGRTPPEQKRELNRAIMPVMVGSAIKPLSVYGPALDNGKSPATIYDDIPLTIDGWDSNQQFPKNFGNKYNGPISMRHAIQKSLNVVAARALVNDVGFEQAADYLTRLGVARSHIQNNGAGLALGTSTLTMVELAAAYGAIANEGVYKEPIAVLKVVDQNGDVIIDNSQNQAKRQVFEKSTAWMLTDMLVSVVEDGSAEAAKIPGMTVAGKTGTNSDHIGVTFAGFTPYYVGTVWIGHDQGKSLVDTAQGGNQAAPLWQVFMSEVHKQKDLNDKPIIDVDPDELQLVKQKICRVSGQLAGQYCPDDDIIEDWFVQGSQPIETCEHHAVIDICTDSNKLATGYCPAESVEHRAVYIPEADSPYRSFTEQQVKVWIPEVLMDFTDVGNIYELNPTDENQAKYFCDVHIQPALLEPIEDVRDIISDFFDKLRQRR